MSLHETLTAIEAGDHAVALREALAAWAPSKHARITAVIEALSMRVASTRTPPGGKSAPEKQAAWLAMANQRDPGDVPVLLATLSTVKKGELLEERLRTFAGRNDPRIAKAMHAILEHPPIPGASGTGTLVAAMELVVAIADPRSDDAWARLVKMMGNHRGASATVGLRAKMPSGSTRLREAFDDITALTDEDAVLLDAIEARLRPTRDAAALFAAVYANPEDDQPRMVLADLLQEVGDPRGELIALQLARTGKVSKREKELLDAHAHDWLGAIAPVVDRTVLELERGFLTKCSVRDVGISATSSFEGLPEWRTVTDLDLSQWSRDPGPLIAGMPRLRVLRGVMSPHLLPPHDAIERLQIGVISGADEIAALDGLSGLRALEIDAIWRDFDEFAPFWKSQTVARLTELSITARAEWLPGLLALGIARIGFKVRPRSAWRLWFEGDVVTVENQATDGYTDELVSLLGLVPDPQRKRVVVEGKVALDLDLRAALAAFSAHDLVE